MTPSGIARVFAISPHLDDAVLSAGSFLSRHPGAVVATVFAGFPPAYARPPLEWDADCGFAEGDDVVALRREEDRRALAHLGAQPLWLDFLDSQYAEDDRPSAEAIADELIASVRRARPDTIAFPLGLDHADHRLTHEACRLLLDNERDIAAHWLLWADIPYRIHFADEHEQKLAGLRAGGYDLEAATIDVDDAKRRALDEYPTQLRGLGPAALENALLPEQVYFVVGAR